MEKIDLIVAKNVKARIDLAGLTQKEVAKRAKLSAEGLNRAISGKVPAGRSTLIAIAKVLKCSVSDFYETKLSFADAIALLSAFEKAGHDTQEAVLSLLDLSAVVLPQSAPPTGSLGPE